MWPSQTIIVSKVEHSFCVLNNQYINIKENALPHVLESIICSILKLTFANETLALN